MKHTLIALVVCSLLLMCTPGWAQTNSGGVVAGTQATIPLSDPVSVFRGNLITQCTGPSDAPFPAANDYHVTLTAPKRLVIGQIDCCCTGDYYQTTVNGSVFGTTPNPCPSGGPGYCAAGTDCWGCVTGTCGSPSIGRSSACLPAGEYHVAVTNPGFAGHSAAEIAAEGMCAAGFTDTFHTTDPVNCTCREVQLGVIALVPDESTFKNHGQYVSAATHALVAIGAPISAECQSCIINQFARSVPQDQMADCGSL